MYFHINIYDIFIIDFWFGLILGWIRIRFGSNLKKVYSGWGWIFIIWSDSSCIYIHIRKALGLGEKKALVLGKKKGTWPFSSVLGRWPVNPFFISFKYCRLKLKHWLALPDKKTLIIFTWKKRHLLAFALRLAFMHRYKY